MIKQITFQCRSVGYFTTIFLLFGLFLTPSVLTAQLSISINSGGVTTVPTGQEVCFDVSYTWSSTTQDLNNSKIEVPIPLPLVGDAVGDVGVYNSPHIQSSAYNPATRKITWTMINPLPAGSSGTVQFCVHFANGTTTNGANVTLTPEISGDGVLPASNSVSLTAEAAAKVMVTKNIRKDPALDNEATYTIVVNNSQGNGNYSLTNAVVTDVLPAGSTFVRASNGGTNSGGTVTWNLGNFPIGSSQTLRVTIIYPSSSFSLGQTVDNTATLTGTTPEGSLPGVSGTKTATISAPIVEANTAKYSWTDWASLGGGTGFSFYTYNTGNVPLNNYSIEDHIPAEFLLRNFGIGYDDNGTQSNVTVEYKTKNNPTWATWPSSPFTVPANPATPDRKYLSVWDLGFDPNGGTDYVTDVRLTWDNLPVGYSTDNASTYIDGTMINPNRDGTTYGMPLKIGNTVNAQYVYNGNTTMLPPVTDSVSIVPISPKPVVTKSLNSAYNQQPNNEIQYNLCLNNNWDASDSLRDAEIADLLPTNMTFVSGSLVNLASIPAPTLTVTDNFNNTGRQLLKFSYAGINIPINTYNCFTIKGFIKPGTSPGVMRNQLYFLSASNSFVNACENPQFVRDTFDIDGDGLTLTDTLPSSYNSELNILETTAIESYKYVKGECDTVFHRYPSVGKTTTNGTFQYKLYVKNVGNKPLTNIKTLDILPWVGDIGVLTYNDSRQSAYRPTFVSMDVVPSNVTIKYGTSSNPCRSDLDPAITEPGGGCDANTFSTTVPTNLEDIRSLIFDFGSIVIQPADSLELRWTMRVPYGVGPDDVAWNSFGHRSESTTGTLVPPAEPIKVGVKVKSAKIGNVVWDDTNKDGILNNGEIGIQGITIRLLDSLMNPVINPLTNQAVTTISDASGNYFFNVAPGTYFVKFDLPSGYAISTANQGGDDTTDSDVDNTGKTTTFITVVDGDNDLKWDAGIYQVCPVAPSITSVTVDTATCTSGVANSDAKITIDGIAVATTYSYSAVSASNLFFSNATAISSGTISLTGLPNPSVPTTYYFRIYASDSLCYKDTTVILTPSVCVAPCSLIAPELAVAGIGFAPGTAPSSENVTLNGGGNVLPESNVAGFHFSSSSEGAFYSICTQISQPILPLQSPYTHQLTNTTNGFSTAAALRIAQVVQVSGFNSVTGFGTGNNTITNFVALQLAVWNALYDTDYSLTAGSFQSLTENNAGARTLGDSWLAAAQNITNPTAVVHNLYHSTGQDLLMTGDVPPITLLLTPPSCSGIGAPNNGGIHISGFTTGQRYQYSTGSTFNAGSAIPASITTIPADSLIVNNLPNTTVSYTVRVYDATDDVCFVDRVMSISGMTCAMCTPPSITNIGVDTATCTNGVANSDAAVFVRGIAGMTKYAYCTNATDSLWALTATASAADSIRISNIANPASATTYTFRIWGSDTTCYNDTTVILTPSVCPLCSITATFTQNSCNNNGTTAIGADDYFTVTVSAVSATNGGASGKYEVILNGTVLNTGGTAYGSPVTIGGAGIFSADGTTTYPLKVRDLDISSCETTVFTTTATAACSSIPCPPQLCIPVTVTRN